MFAKPTEKSELDEAITNIYRTLDAYPPHSTEYAAAADQLLKLSTVKPSPYRVSPDTLAIVVGNLFGVLAIVGHERAHVVASKALNLIIKASR